MVDDIKAGETPEPPRVAPRRLWLIRLVFLAAMLLLGCVAALGYFNALSDAEADRWVDHTYQVIITTGQFMADHRDAAGDARGYMLTGDPQFLPSYHAAAGAIPGDLDRLQSLVPDNPPQVQHVAQLRALSAERLKLMEQTLSIKPLGKPTLDSTVTQQLYANKRSMEALQDVVTQMIREEDQLLQVRHERVDTKRRITLWTIGLGGVISLAALLGCLGLLLTEIRQRRRAEGRVNSLNTELAARNVMLEASNRELEGFSYSISHDLRSPLRAMDGYATLLETRYGSALDAEARRLLGVIHGNTRRMGVLIDDLLAFSRLGRKALEPVTLDMTALATQCVAEVLQVNESRPRVVVAPLPSCRGDRTLIRQVWMNLISNASKYSSLNPEAKIEIQGQQQDGECIYSVRDNGVGFDMQYYHKLFGVFQRLHGVEEFPGTGVGLAIVMRIVTKHGGRIWAEATLGQGATFFFSLPRTEQA